MPVKRITVISLVIFTSICLIGLWSWRIYFSHPVRVRIIKSLVTPALYNPGYAATPHSLMPKMDYLVYRVKIVYAQRDVGTIQCGPDEFRLIIADRNNSYRGLRFPKEMIPDMASEDHTGFVPIVPVPDKKLKPGDSLTGDLVFKVPSGTAMRGIEYKARKGPVIFEKWNFFSS